MTSIESGRVSNREALDVDVFQYLDLLKRRVFLIAAIMLGSLGVAFWVASSEEASYKASAKLLVETDRTSRLTGFGDGVGDFDPLVKAQNPLTTEIEIMTSRPILTEVAERLSLTDASGQLLSANALNKQLTVKILGGADVIQLTYESDDPETSAAVVNELADIYIEANINDNRRKAIEARQLVEQELPESEVFVVQSESSLREFKEENSVISLPDEAKATVQRLEALDTQISDLIIALDEATIQADQLRSSLGLNVQQALLVAELSQSPAVQGVLDELKKVQRQKAIELGFYTARSPVIQNFQDQENSLRSLLQQEMSVILAQSGEVPPERFWQVGELQQNFIADFVDAEVRRLSLSQQLTSLEGIRSAYIQRADALPALEQNQAALERKLEVAKATYQTLLQRLQELRAAENQAVGNARVLEPAIAPEKANSNKKVIMLVGLVTGMFLATTVVTLLEVGEVIYRRRTGRHDHPQPAIVSTKIAN